MLNYGFSNATFVPNIENCDSIHVIYIEPIKTQALEVLLFIIVEVHEF
jgi:hypothetical protein